jgi:hypothetical protein
MKGQTKASIRGDILTITPMTPDTDSTGGAMTMCTSMLGSDHTQFMPRRAVRHRHGHLRQMLQLQTLSLVPDLAQMMNT